MKHMRPLNKKAARIDDYVTARTGDRCRSARRPGPFHAASRPYGMHVDVLSWLGSGFGGWGQPACASRWNVTSMIAS